MRTFVVAAAVGILAAGLTPAVAHAGKLTCLTGTDPSVANDLAHITAARQLIDTQCPCGTYDGSQGKTHTSYAACTNGVIGAEVTAGELRAQCKATVKKYYSTSTCGFPASKGMVACVKQASTGSVSCSIKPAARCAGLGNVACPSFTACIDAADTNHDGRIDSSDGGSCAPVPLVQDDFPGLAEYPSWDLRNEGIGRVTFDSTTPGTAHLNLAGPASSAVYHNAEIRVRLPALPPYCDFEVRLRNSNSNGWDAPGASTNPDPTYGLGSRGWGFWSEKYFGGTNIWFISLSPESTRAITKGLVGPHGAGVMVTNDTGTTALVEKLSIDMTEWHTYRVQWRKDYLGIFIDNMSHAIGEVRDASLIPSVPLTFTVWTDDLAVTGQAPNFGVSHLDVPAINQYIEVDYVRIYQVH